MQLNCGEYVISDDRSLVDLARVHSWLTQTYWNQGCTLEYVERGWRGAYTVFGAYLDGQQVGYMRIVSDGVSFGWVSDVYVDEAHRGKGISKALMRAALEHPDLHDMKRWLLATRDAHGLYESFGFAPLAKPENFLFKGRMMPQEPGD